MEMALDLEEKIFVCHGPRSEVASLPCDFLYAKGTYAWGVGWTVELESIDPTLKIDHDLPEPDSGKVTKGMLSVWPFVVSPLEVARFLRAQSLAKEALRMAMDGARGFNDSLPLFTKAYQALARVSALERVREDFVKESSFVDERSIQMIQDWRQFVSRLKAF